MEPEIHLQNAANARNLVRLYRMAEDEFLEMMQHLIIPDHLA